jgi:hypothetical protein
MAAIENEHLERFDEALQVWTDERFVSRAEIRALAMFSKYLVNLAEDDGWEYCGQSFKRGVPMCTLVVKAYMDEVPVVVFTSARTHTGCVVTFLRKLEQGLLEWREDKYRQ